MKTTETGTGMLGATLFMGKKEEVLSFEVSKEVKEFFQKASDNGTELEGIPLIDCGITIFQQIKNNVPLKMENLYTLYNWASDRINGGWGTFQVNLPQEDIIEFQNFLNTVFSSPEKYKYNPCTKIQEEKLKRKYFLSTILDRKEKEDKTLFMVYAFENSSYNVKFIEMTEQEDSQVFELESFTTREFDISSWENL